VGQSLEGVSRREDKAMNLRHIGRWGARVILRRHGRVKSFEDALTAAGGIVGRFDAGAGSVPTQKIIGSVGRAHNLRSDFFYRTGRAMTGRFVRIGDAMQQGRTLPPVDLYKVKKTPSPGQERAASEYYVVDGHHRVAMARKLGQAFLDAHVVEYTVSPSETTAEGAPDVVLPPPDPSSLAQD
jgi:hypothetical protein